MPLAKPRTQSDIFSEYVALRHSGRTMDEAVERLNPKAYALPGSERHQLSKLVTNWEVNHGANYHPTSPLEAETEVASKPDEPGRTPFGTHFLDPSKLPPVSEQVGIRAIELPAAPAQDIDQTCPNCGKKNRVKDTYCYSCGHILKIPTGIMQRISEMDHQTRFGTANFGKNSTLYLAIRGVAEPLHVSLWDEMVLGRSSAESMVEPDIDLAPFDAETLGVSRLHAALKRTGNTVSLTDLQSSNRTYVNGQVMYPHEVRVLRDGDEIRLGKLVIRVVFRH